MIDHHIHIGQFCENYYNPAEILQIVSDVGVEKCLYSSTSSCRYKVSYAEIEREINLVAKHFQTDKMQALLWFIPDYIRQGLTVETAFAGLPYQGVKLHPKAHQWNLNDPKQLDCLHVLFGFADEKRLPILIHTGEDEDRPDFFEQFFAKYQNAKIILAHCRPVGDTIKMFEKYSHLYGDLAFVPQKDIQSIIKQGYKDRLLAGTDFPITHYYYGKDKSLKTQYKEDVRILDANLPF